MSGFAQRQGSRSLVLLAGIALAVSACGGGSATTGPSTSGGNGESSAPSATSVSSAGPTETTGPSLSGAAGALAGLNSYRFTMTLAGGAVSDTLSNLPGPGSGGNGPFDLSGTFILTPAKAADVTVAGALHIVSVGGSDYQDPGITGSFTKTDTTGIIDSLSPAVAFASLASFSGGFDAVGSETKNGVDTVHFQAGSSALAELASVASVKDATWTADIWVATDGGYPASVDIEAKASDNSIAYEIRFDLTNVNDPANSVTAPTNVTGA